MPPDDFYEESASTSGEGIASDSKVERWEWWHLASILGIACLLRLINLNSGLWYDEIMTLVSYVRLPTKELVTDFSSLNNHILYSLAAQASVSLFGESPWALRLPAVFFGVASVAAIWWLGRQILGRKQALLCALFLATSFHHIWFSQNARGYTGLLLGTLVGTILFLKGLNRPSWPTWTAYALNLMVSMYLHLSAAFLFATHALICAVLLVKRQTQRREEVSPSRLYPASVGQPLFGFFLGAALVLFCYGPLLPQMVDTFVDASEPKTYGGVSEWKNPIWTVVEMVDSFAQERLVFLLGLGIGGILTGLGAAQLMRQQAVFACVPILHVPLTLVALLMGSFRIWPRYFFVDAGFGILFLVHGIFFGSRLLANWVASKPRPDRGERIGILVTAIGIAGSLFLLPPLYLQPKQDFQGAREFVESARSGDDVVASVGLAATSFEYYAPNWTVVETPEALDRLRAEADRVWLVYSFPKHTSAKYPEIMRVVSGFELMKTFGGTLREGEVLVYRSR